MRWKMSAMMMCMVFMFTAGVALADGGWVDELMNSLTFYQTNYPESDWGPYIDKIVRIQEGRDQGDQQMVSVEMNGFLRMLRTRAHGIDDVAADELYNFAVTLASNEQSRTATASELGIGSERPMSVPESMIQTPYQGGPPCQPGGCDYWLDDVFDAGAQ